MIRKSNYELLRIIAMLMIVLLHMNYFSLGQPSQEDILSAPCTSFWRILAEQLCIIGANVFIMISGWFGIKPTIKSICSLLFQVLFWALTIVFVGQSLLFDIPIKLTAKTFWFGSTYWFIVSYIGLFILSPVLNSFIETASVKQYSAVLISFFTIEFVYGWIVDSPSFNEGYSIISFIGLYLLARFIRLHATRLKSVRPATCLLLYLSASIVPAVLSYISIRNGWREFNPIFYTSPFVLTASVFFFLIFTKYDYYSSTINWMGASTLAVYLAHQHPIIIPDFRRLMVYLSDSYSTISYTLIALILAIALLLVCVILDQIRISCWKFLCSKWLDDLFYKIDRRFSLLFSD